MEKRTKLAIVILVGLLLLGAGAFIFLSPYLAERRAAQPPALPGSVTPGGQPATSGEVPKPVAPITTAPPAAPSSDAAKLLALENRARTVVERVGSGASSDGFLGYRDVEGNFTPNGVSALRADRAALQKQYPAGGPTVGISTKAASTNLANGKYGDATLAVEVEAIQRADIQGKPPVTGGKRATLTFAKQADGSYLIDSMKWEDVAL